MELTHNGTVIKNATYNGGELTKITYDGVTVWKKSGNQNLVSSTTFIPSGTQLYNNTISASYGYIAVRVRATNGCTIHVRGAEFKIQGKTLTLQSTLTLDSNHTPYTCIFWWTPDQFRVKFGNVQGTQWGNWITSDNGTANTVLDVQGHQGADLYTCYSGVAFTEDDITYDAPDWAQPVYIPPYNALTASTSTLAVGTNLAKAIWWYGYVAVRVRANGAIVQVAGAEIVVQNNQALLHHPGETTAIIKHTGGLPYTCIFWYRTDRNYVKVGNASGTAYGNWTDMGAPTPGQIKPLTFIVQNHGGADVYECYYSQPFGDTEIVNAPDWAKPEYTP